MFELVRFGMLNWYLVGFRDIDVSGNVAVLGPNASGKSSLLDMAQTVLLGLDKKKNHLNSSAGDGSRKKSKRTVRDYCLGMTDSGPSREACETIIFLGFEDRADGRKVTIGCAIEASIDVPSEKLRARFIVPGTILSTSMFVEERDGEVFQKDWEVCRKIIAEAGIGEETIFDTSSRDFIRNWSRLISTGNRPADPDRLARALVTGITFSEIESATDFVRNYVLEKKDIDIRAFKNSVQTYQDIAARISDMKAQIEIGKEIILKGRRHGRLLTEVDEYSAAAALLTYTSSRSIYFVNVNGTRKGQEDIEQSKREIARIQREIADAEREKDEVEALISAESNAQQRKLLLAGLPGHEATEQAAGERLQRLHLAVSRLCQRANQAAGSVDLSGIKAELFDLADSLRGRQHPNWPEDISKVDAAIAGIASAAGKIEKVLRDAEGSANVVLAKARSDLQEIEDVLGNIRRHGSAIDSRTLRFVDALKARGMKPRIFCELVDCIDPEWTDAAESLLGRYREAIIVEAGRAREAKEMLRAQHGFGGCMVVSTDKEDWESPGHRGDSVAAVLRTNDPDAQILIDKQLGGIRRAEDVADLRRAGRAITRDRIYDNGIVTEQRRLEGRRKLGASATDQASLEHLAQALGRECDEIERKIRLFGDLRVSIEALSGEWPGKVMETVTAFGEAREKHREVLEEIASLEKMIRPEYSERLARVKKRLFDLREAEKDENGEIRAAEQKIKTYSETLDRGELSPGSRYNLLRTRAEARRLLRMAGRRQAFRAAREFVPDKVIRNGEIYIASSGRARKKSDSISQEATRISASVFDLVSDYAQRWQISESFRSQTSNIAGEVVPFFENIVARIEDVELIEHEKRAREAAENANVMFRTSFVAELYGRIAEVRQEVDRLNSSLGRYRFCGERYRFKIVPHPEFEKVISFVSRAAQDDSVINSIMIGSKDGPMSEGEEIFAYLMNEETDLGRVEDYRNLFLFDILMHDEKTGYEVNLEKRRGTGSGAERQAPFYVAIGSALASAWHGGEQRRNAKRGAGLAVFDEAFSKMDGKNQRACLDFFKNLGLQTIIAAPIEKMSIAASNMDTVVEVWRNDRIVEFHELRIKPHAHSEIAKVDPSGITAADLRLADEKKKASGEKSSPDESSGNDVSAAAE